MRAKSQHSKYIIIVQFLVFSGLVIFLSPQTQAKWQGTDRSNDFSGQCIKCHRAHDPKQNNTQINTEINKQRTQKAA